MTVERSYKIKKMLRIWPLHTIATSTWLKKNDIMSSNIEKYIQSGWIQNVGHGAYQRVDDNISWEGVLYGLQTQYPSSFHVGGRSALELLGAAHFLSLGHIKPFIFTSQKKKPAKWFGIALAKLSVDYVQLQNNSIASGIGMTTYDCGEFKIVISTRERAALELVDLLGRFHDFEECKLIFENLNTARSDLIQELLENCTSVKSKRVFLFLAKRLEHKWFEILNLSKIDLGVGPRNITPGGTYDKEFQITYPKEIFYDDKIEV